MSKHLSEPLLHRLITDGLNGMLGAAPDYYAVTSRGASLVLCGEPVADLNYISLSAADASSLEQARGHIHEADRRGQPFILAVAESVADEGARLCEAEGLVHATSWPLMVCSKRDNAATSKATVEVSVVADTGALDAMAAVLADAYSMPLAAIQRVMPLSLYDSPGIASYIAAHDGGVESSVTITRHGKVRGVWAMGTTAGAQGKGIGKALLIEAMNREWDAGAEAFFLGATPAGFPLYQKLGYETVSTAGVWVRGETSQA